MPTDPSKRGQRKRFIRRRIERDQKRIRAILLSSKAVVDARILEAARAGKFATSARFRDVLYRDIAGLYQEMGGNIDEWNRKMTTATAKEWHKFGISDLPVSERNVTFETFSRKHLDDYLAFVHPDNPNLAFTATTGLATQDERFIRGAVTDVFRKANIVGTSIRDQQKELLARVTAARPDWKFIDSAGRAWKPQNYFNMLARTTVARVARESYNDTVIEQGHDLARIAGGPPTAPPPDPCWRWYGKIVSLTGETPGYPTLAEAEGDGLFHPNCIHYTAVILPEELEEEQEREAVVDDNRTEMGEKALEREEESKEKQRKAA